MSSFTTKDSTSTIGIKRPADTPPPPVKNPRTDGVDPDLIIGPSTAPVLTRRQLNNLLDEMETEFIDQISSCDVNEQTSVKDNLTDSIAKIKKGFDKNPNVDTE